MADKGDTGEAGDETGGFVFGDGRTDDESGATIAGFDAETIAAAALLVVVVVVLVYVAQLLVTGAVTDLLGGNADGSADGSAVPNGTVTGTTTVGTASATGTTGTAGENGRTDGTTTVTQQPSASPSSPPTATPTRTETATATTTATPTQSGGDGGTEAGDGGGDGTEGETATPDERSPVIGAFTITDRSAGGTAVFDVAWNVSDPDRDLVAVRVSLVADSDGEARIVEQRRFDAGGAQATGSTTFEVPDGAGETYEVRIEVVDGNGNTVFSLTRVVADGRPDE